MIKNNLPFRLLSFLIFMILLIFGFRLASQKPLWNDEIYSQIASVENLTYVEILRGKISEGNATPLFYILQKAVCQITHYHTPEPWHRDEWTFDRMQDRIVLRIVSVLCTAGAIALIFYHFLKFHSLPTALFSLLLSLSTAILLHYWGEARPYALWIFLTTVQILLFLKVYIKEAFRPSIVRGLAVVHVFLSLTVVLSLAQILLISFLIWLNGLRERKYYFFLLFVPLIIGFGYYSVSPKYPFALIFSIEQYIRANISRDRFYIAVLFMLGLAVHHLCERFKMDNIISPVIKKGIPALIIFVGAMAGACVILADFKVNAGPVMQFPVTEKYLIFLAPIGIITTTLFADVLVRAVKMKWVSFIVLAMIAGLTLPRFMKVMSDLCKQYPHLFLS